MARLGKPPTPWQRHVLDVALEIDPATGRLAYREVRLWVPRQSGKTSLLMGLLLWRCLAWADQGVVYTAQTRNHARQKFVEEQLPTLLLSSFKRQFTPRLSNGSEHLTFRKKGALPSRWGIDSTTKKAGHGSTLDMVIADEFFAQEDDRLESGARPTMITRPMPQMWFVSTFGEDDENQAMGQPLWDKVDDGRKRCVSGRFGSVAYFEWSAADVDTEDVDYGDEEMWIRTMPALECNGGIIAIDAVRQDYESMSIGAFKRAYLNLRPQKVEIRRVFPGSTWANASDPKSNLVGLPLAVTWDVAPDSSSASIAFAGRRADGKWHGELVECRQGTRWMVPRLVEAVQHFGDRVRALGVLPGATAGGFIDDVSTALKAAGIVVAETAKNPGLHIIEVSPQHYAQECVTLFNAVVGDEFRHLDQDWLNAAVAGAKQKPHADSFVWDRRKWAADITPLCAVTVAMRAFTDAPEPKKLVDLLTQMF